MYSIPQVTIREMLRKTAYAASQDDTRRTLKGVLMNFKDEKLTMVATDGRRLALVENELEFPKAAEKDIVLPSKAVAELQRSLSAEGRSAARLNGRPLTLSLLKAAGELLVNIHGQSDTHTLTERDNQLAILDGYAENAELLTSYREIFKRLSTVRASIREITTEEAARLREIEMLRYQIADIESLGLREGEEEKLEEKKKRLKSIERIAKQTTFAYRALRSAEKANVTYILDRAIAAVNSLSDVIATGAVLPRSGSISAGTSGFSQQVLERPLKNYYPEIDVVTTPDGATVAMVHCNNGCSELDAFAAMFAFEYKRLTLFVRGCVKVYGMVAFGADNLAH